MSDPHLRLNVSSGLASVGVAALLVTMKLWALGSTGSLSIAASLADSGLDLMVSLGGLAAIVYAARPPDEDHTFGHTSAEDLAALGQALFILLAAAAIAAASVRRLLSGTPPELSSEGRGLLVMGLSIVVTGLLVLWQRRVARITGNRVVAADSLHYMGDLFPNIGAILALAASAWFGMTGVDSVVALGAAGLLAVGALGIGRSAWNALMDRRADPGIVAGIEDLAASWPGVRGYHELRTRSSGTRVFVNLHIELDAEQTLSQAHEIGAGLRLAILNRFPETDVIIHMDPVPGSVDPAARRPGSDGADGPPDRQKA